MYLVLKYLTDLPWGKEAAGLAEMTMVAGRLGSCEAGLMRLVTAITLTRLGA